MGWLLGPAGGVQVSHLGTKDPTMQSFIQYRRIRAAVKADVALSQTQAGTVVVGSTTGTSTPESKEATDGRHILGKEQEKNQSFTTFPGITISRPAKKMAV